MSHNRTLAIHECSHRFDALGSAFEFHGVRASL
ncbi:hypothetical protein CI41S_19240 [Bradyrhizobium ivorense]|nr:hypothetical protein CI41S_19240 [Bradyrhizobium ivorense]